MTDENKNLNNSEEEEQKNKEENKQNNENNSSNNDGQPKMFFFNGMNNDGNDPFGFDNIDEIFKAMSNAIQNPNPSTKNPNNNEKQNNKDKKQNNEKNNANVFGNIFGQSNNSVLAQYGLNLTELAKKGKLDPVIGRNNEVQRTIEILNRRTKNNPVLIGEPGVGKTAIVEALAQQIVNGKVPDKLANKQIIRLDMVSIVQGTAMRGQFEQRIQNLIKEVSERDDVILFIDEIHEIMGAGSAEGSLDAGNILKPALARGEFQLIGATTLNEYRKIEKDGAIARRFQPVQVNEPSREETLVILRGIKSKYENYHHVKYDDSALEAAVDLSSRYIADRFLPDKAIDLFDEAGSKRNLKIELVNLDVIQKKIDTAEQMKQDAIDTEDYEKASYWRDQVNQLTRQLEKAKQQPQPNTDMSLITETDIIQVVEEKTGIPVGEIKENEANHLRSLDANLEAKVIGQNKAIEQISKAIRRSRIGLTKTGRPIASFLFVGPTGVGKTETAKQLAKEIFGNEDAMIRFDMSEYMEKHSVSKLIGAPAGYIGYEEAGQLSEQVRRKPYSLVLLDEVEKAHPDVMNMFLQILDDGRLTDSQGKVVSFKDTIIIMTSNAGSNDVGNNPVGFGSNDEDKLLRKLQNYFRPEFLNRFDDIIEFNNLSKEDLLKIVDILLAKMNDMLQVNGINVQVTAEVKNKLVDLGYNPSMGARPLRRTIRDQIEDKIADAYLINPEQKTFEAILEDDKITIINK